MTRAGGSECLYPTRDRDAVSPAGAGPRARGGQSPAVRSRVASSRRSE